MCFRIVTLMMAALPLLADAQNIGINVNGAAPNASALLDIDVSAIAGTKRGLLIPRMTTVERNGIPAPANSLLIFNTTTTQFEYFDGLVWRVLMSNASGWALTGNVGTNPATDFVGTADAQPLRFRAGNTFAGSISNTPTGLVSLGFQAGQVNTATGNTFVGGNAGLTNIAGNNNTFIGNNAGAANVATGNNTYVGTNAGAANANGQQNVFIGRLAGGSCITGSDNILIGNGAGLTTTANNNVMVGSFSGNSNTSGGGNTFLGTQSGQSTTTGGQNTFIGTVAGGSNVNGQQNTLIGNGAAVGGSNLINATAIGRASQVDASNALVLGSVNGVNSAASTVKVGIGTTNPLDRLHVVGSIRMVDGSQAAGRIMMSNVNGTATWVDPSTLATGLVWNLTGNASTDPATNFIGTTDFQALRFRTANQDRVTIANSGLVGLGTTLPQAALHVASFGTLSGVGVFTDAVIRGESNSDAFVHLCTPNNGQSGILFGTPSQSVGAGVDFGVVGTGDLGFRLNNTYPMTIDGPTGNVGVGTTLPVTDLEVNGTGTQTIRVNSTSGVPGIAAVELMRQGIGPSDWQIRNESGLLFMGQSSDDLVNVTDVLRLGGGSVTPASDNTITLGQASLRWTTVFATSGVVNTSDARDKINIRPLNYGLTEILQLKPVRYEWKNGMEKGDKLGLVAQDLQNVLPETVVSRTWRENEDGSGTHVDAERLGVYYSDIIPVLVHAIQEQQGLIEELRQELESLKAR